MWFHSPLARLHLWSVCPCLSSIEVLWEPVSQCNFGDCISKKLCRITSWRAEPVTYSSVMGSISAGSLALFACNRSQMCTPLCPTSCCSRLAQTPHTVFRLYYSKEGLGRGRGGTWHRVSECLIWLSVLLTCSFFLLNCFMRHQNTTLNKAVLKRLV